MKKEKKETVKLIVEIEVPFASYEKESFNKKARKGIIKWVKETCLDHLSYIPLYVKPGDYGALEEDSTEKTKIKVVEVMNF